MNYATMWEFVLYGFSIGLGTSATLHYVAKWLWSFVTVADMWSGERV